MSNAAAKDKGSFFSIYKPGQGKWVRWGTVAGAAVMAGIGAIWLADKEQHVGSLPPLWKTLVVVIWILLWAWATFWFVNSPKYGEFMIMTESEMRKVSWPSRKEVITSVKIVIILTFMLGIMLGVVDVGFISLFRWLGLG